ncbi:MAG: DUF2079 domain-containing protein [Rickettsiales bacterium]|nr:DUF2079 domain-containing protein [Rickettsiales bacterium]
MRLSAPAIGWIGLSCYSALFIAYSLARFYGLKTSLFDLGVFDQLMSNMLAGRGMVSTINPPYDATHWLGFHFSPILYALLPIYALAPYPETLLIINVLCIALTAVPLYRIARHWNYSAGYSLLWCIFFLLNPFTISALLFDFHEVVIATLAMACALYAQATKRFVALLFALIILLLCKEHYGLSVIGFGLLWALTYKDWKRGGLIIALGVASLILVLGIIMPLLNQQPIFQLSAGTAHRYDWLFTHESLFATLPTLAIDAAYYLGFHLLLWCALPLGSLAWLLPAASDLLANMLSLNPMMRSASSYHSAAIIVVMMVTALRTASALQKKQRACMRKMMLCVGLATALGFLNAPLSPMRNMWEINLADHTRTMHIGQIAALLSPNDSVAAQSNIGSFFSQRAHITPYIAQTDAQVIILHLAYPFSDGNSLFNIPYEVSKEEYLRAVKATLNNRAYGVVYWQDHWLVLKKGLPYSQTHYREIIAQLDALSAQ